MSSQAALDELKAAAAALETRARILGVETSRIEATEWDEIGPHLEPHIPRWFRELLSEFSLYGIILDVRNSADPIDRAFSFSGPEDLNATFSTADDSLYLPLLEHGFAPIGYESDGNLWLLKSPYSETSPVFMLDLSAWGGGKPTQQKGLVFAGSRLALLLCSTGISDQCYEGPSIKERRDAFGESHER